jgi:hypothetical protein
LVATVGAEGITATIPSGVVSGSSQLTSSLDGRYLQSGSSLSSDSITFNRTAGINVTEGQMAWNNSDGTLDIGLNYGDVVLQVGQEQHYVVRNSTGTTIPNGTAVYASGVSVGSKRIEVSPFTANGTTDEIRFLGLATHNISDGVNGIVSNFGYVRGLDTRGTSATAISVGDETWAEGDILYAHPTAAGKLTKVAPKDKITVAMITTRHQTTGVLFVRPSSFGHIDDLHDVQINTDSLVTGSMLEWNGGYFVNNNTFSSSVDSRLDTLEATYATTGSNLFVGTQTHSGSIIPATDNTYDLGSPTYQWRDIFVSSGSLYIDGTKVLSSTGNELQITTDAGQSIKILEAGSDSIILQSADGDIQLKSSGGGNLLFDPTTGLIDVRGTLQIQNGNKITSSDGNAIQFGNNIAITGSIVSTTTPLVSGSSQIDLTQTTGYSTFSSSVNSRVANFESNSGTYATTGSNTFIGTQTITGSLFISSNLVVQGSSSLQNITASAVSIGTNIVNLNTATPAIRYAGLVIGDSGSVGGSGSFLYDSVQDEMLFIHRGDSSVVTSSVALMGPETYDNLGNETYLTTNRLPKGTGKEHLVDSNITDTGTLITLGSNTTITGTLSATGTTLVSGSSQITFSGISSLPTLVSGSSQVDVMSTTNIARLATTGSNQFNGNQIITGSLVIGAASALYPVSVYTSSANTNNVIAEFYNGDYTAGTKNFIRVRNNVSIGSSMSSYFGQGQDNNTYIVSNDFSRGGDIVINGNTGDTTFVGNVIPKTNNSKDLGSATYGWRNIYTNDLHLSNEGKPEGNDIDGTTGNWTIQEGAEHLYIINNKTGKKFKFSLEEIQ